MTLQHPDKQKIEISYATLYIGGGISIIALILFVIIANALAIPYEIRDLVAILTCGIVSTTLIYHAKNLRLNYEANQEKLNFDRHKFEEEKRIKKEEAENKVRVYSFEITTVWFKPDMAENVEISRCFILGKKNDLINGDIHGLVTDLDKDVQTRKSLVCVLNYFENLSLMIKNNLVDEESIKKCFKTLFVDYHKVLSRYIKEVQKTSSRYLVNYEEIAMKWERS